MKTVHTLTTFQLRQEIERRGLIDDLKVVNYNTLLQRLALVEDERAAEANCEAAAIENTAAVDTAEATETLQQRLQREKEERKAVALERSKARQAEASYFPAKLQANEQKAKVAEVSDSSTEQTAASSTDDTSEEPLFSKVNPKGYKVFSK
eukprot:3070-Heterococcus_DN1.PRE.7